ncbi:MAG: T9SS type A sorting domain-containing protein, partial [Flavobacterium sp.]
DNFRRQLRAVVPSASSLPPGSTITGYRFRIFNITRGGYVEIEKSTNSFNFLETEFGRYNTVYHVEVAVRLDDEWMPFGSPCVITTVTAPEPTQLINQHCGGEFLTATSIIRCNPVQLAEQYHFKVEFLENEVVTAVGYYDSAVPNFRLSNVQGIPTFAFDQDYLVSVAVTYPSSWNSHQGIYGEICEIFSRRTPFPGLVGCDGEIGLVLISPEEVFSVTPIAGANRYRIELTNSNNQSQTITKTTNHFSLSDFNLLPEISYGDVLYTRVWVRVSGSTLFHEGKDCTVSLPNADRPAVEFYPNPFNESITLYWEDNVTPLNVRVYNSMGTMVESHNSGKIAATYLKVGNTVSPGVYIVRVEFEQDTQVFRIAKN